MSKPTLITIAIIATWFTLFAYLFGSLDQYFEPTPQPGDVWQPRFDTVQPHWPSFWDTDVVDVKDGYVLTRLRSMNDAYSLHDFHARYDLKWKASEVPGKPRYK